MIESLQALQNEALDLLARTRSADDLEVWRLQYLARSGHLSLMMRGVGQAPSDERPLIGRVANEVKRALEGAFDARRMEIERSLESAASDVDVTMPGRPTRRGSIHPTIRAVREIVNVFQSIGFRVAEGPEVEWERYNFDLLNIPRDHPARDMHDTYWLDTPTNPGSMLLRTHTSPNQIRIMERTAPPVRVVVPGRVYRYESVDATHETMFFQIEGLAVDKGITMGDLKGTLTAFARAMFGPERRVLFYCSYFPFVEPGVEVAIDCFACGGKGCRICKHSGWIEIMGAGMVHPNVLRAVGYDPDSVTGFAFGMGPERVAMLKYGIDDIRLFYGNDLRFLRQFA